MKCPTIDARLASLSDFVRQGAVFADVGTDHAHLPLFLLKEGKISRAICTDINDGPLSRAKANAAAAGQSENITFLLSDGAAELSSYGVTDVAICGMGGELIAAIIDRAPFLKSGEIRLILQPMTRVGALRSYLWDNGFEILRESYSEAAGKSYVAMLVCYTGVAKEHNPFLLEFGEFISEYHTSDKMKRYVDARIRAIRASALGKASGGESCELENYLLAEARKGGIL